MAVLLIWVRTVCRNLCSVRRVLLSLQDIFHVVSEVIYLEWQFYLTPCTPHVTSSLDI